MGDSFLIPKFHYFLRGMSMVRHFCLVFVLSNLATVFRHCNLWKLFALLKTTAGPDADGTLEEQFKHFPKNCCPKCFPSQLPVLNNENKPSSVYMHFYDLPATCIGVHCCLCMFCFPIPENSGIVLIHWASSVGEPGGVAEPLVILLAIIIESCLMTAIEHTMSLLFIISVFIFHWR